MYSVTLYCSDPACDAMFEAHGTLEAAESAICPFCGCCLGELTCVPVAEELARGPRALGDRGTRGPQAPPAAPQRPKAASQSGLRLSDPLDPSVCLQPWPNDYFTVDDPSTDTGKRLNLQLLDMPRNVANKPIDPTDWNRNDGFSPGQDRLRHLPRGIRPRLRSNGWQPAHRPLKLADLHAHYRDAPLPDAGGTVELASTARGRDRLRDKLRALLIRIASRFANYESFESGPRVTVSSLREGGVRVVLSVLYSPFDEMDLDQPYGAPPESGYLESILDQARTSSRTWRRITRRLLRSRAARRRSKPLWRRTRSRSCTASRAAFISGAHRDPSMTP